MYWRTAQRKKPAHPDELPGVTSWHVAEEQESAQSLCPVPTMSTPRHSVRDRLRLRTAPARSPVSE